MAGPDQTLGVAQARPGGADAEAAEDPHGHGHEGHGQEQEDDDEGRGAGTTTPGFPTGYSVLTAPGRSVIITCDSTVSTLCPSSTTGVQPVPGVTYYYLFKHGRYPGDTSSPYPQMTGKDLELSGTAATTTRRAARRS